jgi:hypothetical protein
MLQEETKEGTIVTTFPSSETIASTRGEKKEKHILEKREGKEKQSWN